jgi:uncharacterized protein
MALYNKIIFTGPVGAGKSTAIKSISDSAPVSTDESASDMTRDRKASTTVALDYGVMNLPDGEKIHLYGTPGQERFDFMWEILTTGGIGLVLLLDNTRADPFQDMKLFLNKFLDFTDSTSLVVGVTQMDLKPLPLIDDYYRQVERLGFKPPIFEVDARSRTDVSTLVQALLYVIDPVMEDE